MPTLDDLARVSLNFSEAVLDENLWDSALQDLADTFNGSFATFEVIDKSSGRHILHHDSSDFEIQNEYLGYYMPKNPRLAFGKRLDSPQIMHDRLFMSDNEMDRDEFYADFLRPHDLRYFLCFKAYESDTAQGVFTIQKSARNGPATKEELRAIAEVGEHLSNVAEFQMRHQRLANRQHLIETAFDTLKDGLVILNENGIIECMNQAAQDMFHSGDGLEVVHGKPGCKFPEINLRIEETVSEILNNGRSNLIKHQLVPRPSGLPPYHISFQTIARTDTRFFGGKAQILLTVQDPVRQKMIDIETIMDCFGFTQSEANIALTLANGQTAQKIADTTKISLPTVRTHIQRIMQKMSTNRQSEVVRILSRYL